MRARGLRVVLLPSLGVSPTVALFALAPLLLSGCVSGFTQMSDQFCSSHPKAPHWRCWDHK